MAVLVLRRKFQMAPPPWGSPTARHLHQSRRRLTIARGSAGRQSEPGLLFGLGGAGIRKAPLTCSPTSPALQLSTDGTLALYVARRPGRQRQVTPAPLRPKESIGLSYDVDTRSGTISNGAPRGQHQWITVRSESPGPAPTPPQPYAAIAALWRKRARTSGLRRQFLLTMELPRGYRTVGRRFAGHGTANRSEFPILVPAGRKSASWGIFNHRPGPTGPRGTYNWSSPACGWKGSTPWASPPATAGDTSGNMIQRTNIGRAATKAPTG